MKFLPTIALLFAFQFVHAQAVERWEYCQIYYQTGGFNSKTTVTVDYGEKTIKALGKAELLRDSTGSDTFKSPIDAYDFLGDQGWECFSTYSSAEFGKLQYCWYCLNPVVIFLINLSERRL